jgi:hypothetical protein
VSISETICKKDEATYVAIEESRLPAKVSAFTTVKRKPLFQKTIAPAKRYTSGGVK